jgi:protein phosphatase
MPLALRVGSCTLQGRRSDNEDAVAVGEFPDVTILAVADGMGGGSRGALASRRAVETVLACLNKAGRDSAGVDGTDAVLRQAVLRADEEVRALQEQWHRAGSTLTVGLWFRETATLHLAHVGDGAAYQVRGRTIERLTTCHTVREALVRHGTITREQASSIRGGGRLTRYLGNDLFGYLGNDLFEGPDIRAVPIQAGDRFVLCTDGVFLREQELVDFIHGNADVQRCAEGLCRQALDQGSRDNISCIVVEVV